MKAVAHLRLSASTALALMLLAACSNGAGPGSASGAGAPADTFQHIHGLAVASDGTLYVATHGGLIKQAGTGWVYASSDRNDHMGFSMDPKSGTMWRSGHSPSRPSLGVETSTDGGKTWSRLSDVLNPPVDFHAMTVSYANDKTLFGWDSGRRGLFRSTDAGRTWEKLPQNPFAYVLSAPAEARLVFVGVAEGLLRSTDAGKSWQPVQPLAGGWVIGVAAAPSDPKRILAFTQKGMKVSRDAGVTWSPAGGGLPSDAELTSLAIDPSNSDVAYASDAATIYKTTDAGKSWSVIRSGA